MMLAHTLEKLRCDRRVPLVQMARNAILQSLVNGDLQVSCARLCLLLPVRSHCPVEVLTLWSRSFIFPSLSSSSLSTLFLSFFFSSGLIRCRSHLFRLKEGLCANFGDITDFDPHGWAADAVRSSLDHSVRKCFSMVASLRVIR